MFDLSIMKKVIILILGGLLGFLKDAPAQSIITDNGFNRVITRIPRVSTSNPYQEETAVSTSVLYSDGAGRVLQTVNYKNSPNHNDVISGIIFDALGRQEKTFLPYPANSTNASFQSNPEADVKFSYGDLAPFTKAEFDAAGRPFASYGPGNAWQSNGKKIFENVEIIGSLDFYYTDAETNANTVFKSTYGPGIISKKTTTSEDGRQISEYMNKDGLLIRKEMMGLVTHFVYDPLDRLVCTIPPKMNPGNGFNIDDQTELVFASRYDNQGRVIASLTPGGGWTEMVYNRLGHLVMSRNPRHAANAQWLISKKDVLGRNILQAVLANSESRQTWQDRLDNESGEIYETRGGGLEGYTNRTLPVLSSGDVMTVNYYDDYNWGVPLGYDCSAGGQYLSDYGQKKLTGLLTGIKTRMLDGGAKPWMEAVLYYNNLGQIIQTNSKNRFGQMNTTNLEYLFSGEITKETTIYRKSGQSDLTIINSYEYDHAGRKTKYKQQSAGNQEITIAEYVYDNLNRLITKKIQPGIYNGGSSTNYPANLTRTSTFQNQTDIATTEVLLQANFDGFANYDAYIGTNQSGGGQTNALQTIDYTYDIRGNVRTINGGASSLDASQNDLFGMQYTRHEDGVYYAGNLRKQEWISKSRNNNRSFTYNYDGQNRLSNASYSGVSPENYTLENVSYDLNGNITTLKRYGMNSGTPTGPGGFGVIDNLNYQYNNGGNKLQYVSDTEANNKPAEVQDFKDRNTGANDYDYNADGSISADRNREITSITYNHLGLAERLVLTGGREIQNVYDASGVRLYKIVKNNGVEKRFDYVGAVIYVNQTPYSIATDEGRLLKDQSGQFSVYEYQYRDLQGNLRIAYRQQGQTISSFSSFEPKEQADQTSLKVENAEPYLSTQTAYSGQYSAKVWGGDGPSKTVALQAGETINVKVFARYELEKQKKKRKLWLPVLWFGKEKINDKGKELNQAGNGGEEQWMVKGGLAVPVNLGTKTVEKGERPAGYLRLQILDSAGRVTETRNVLVTAEAKDDWQELNADFKAASNVNIKILLGNGNDVPVHFDNLTITQEPAIIVQENHYDPWGIELVGIETVNTSNSADNFLFQGKEREYSFGLYSDSFGWRDYDPSLGIWHTQDPEGQFDSPYVGLGNMPNMHIDPDGRILPVIIAIGAVIGAGVNVARNWDAIAQGGSISWGKALAFAGVGALEGGFIAAAPGAGFARLAVTTFGRAVIGGLVKNAANLALGGHGDIHPMTLVKEAGVAAITAGTFKGVLNIFKGSNFFTGTRVVPGDVIVGQVEKEVVNKAGEKTLEWSDDFAGNTSGQTYQGVGEAAKGGGTTALAKYWPENGGALGKWESEFLMPGTEIDRFGSGFGKYFSPRKTPMDMRALPGENTGAYNAFRVVKPFEVQSSTIAPAFGKIGLGKQYLSPVNMNTLLKRGIIVPIK